MEVVGLALIGVVVAIWYGVFDTVEVASGMANREMRKFEAEQIARHNEFFASVSYSDDDADKISKAREYFKAQAKL